MLVILVPWAASTGAVLFTICLVFSLRTLGAGASLLAGGMAVLGAWVA